MNAKTALFWDNRMLYIYAILGGFVETSDEQISFRIQYLTNQIGQTEYCLHILSKLEDLQLITFSNIEFNEKQSIQNTIERTGVPPSPHFIIKDKEQIKEHWKDKIDKLSTAKKVKRIASLVSSNGRYDDIDKHGCIKFNLTVKDKDWFYVLRTLGENLVLKDKKLLIEPNKWLVPIAEGYSEIEKAYLKVRTNKKATTKQLEAAMEPILKLGGPYVMLL